MAQPVRCEVCALKTATPARVIRIAEVVGGLDRGGAETWLVNVLRTLDRSRFRMDFVVHEERSYPYEPEILAHGGRVLRCLRPDRPISYFRRLRALLQDHGPYDVVHSHIHHYSGWVLAAAAAAGVNRRVVHGHLGARKSDLSFGRRLFTGVMTSLIGRYATGGLAVAREAAPVLFGARWESDPRWRLLYCGIDLAPFSSPTPERVRAALHLSRECFVMGHVGRFDPQKNHEGLLAVAQEVFRRRPESHLLLVGTGPLRGAIEGRVAEMGLSDRVSFLGPRSDVPELLGAMDVFVFPSLYEGLPLAVLEAQAAGVSSVLSTAVTEEVLVAPELVTRVSLSAGPSGWADAILGARRPTAESRARALAAFEGSRFDVRTSARALADYYAEG